MKKRDIESREDIEMLIRTFYGKVRQHDKIGPFFNEMISDWNKHQNKLTNFWETNLFLVDAYKGNPVRKHIEVDTHFQNGVEQAHFGHWLQLWFNTVDDLFEGKNAHLAKERARNMSHIMFIRIFQARKKEGVK